MFSADIIAPSRSSYVLIFTLAWLNPNIDSDSKLTPPRPSLTFPDPLASHGIGSRMEMVRPVTTYLSRGTFPSHRALQLHVIIDSVFDAICVSTLSLGIRCYHGLYLPCPTQAHALGHMAPIGTVLGGCGVWQLEVGLWGRTFGSVSPTIFQSHSYPPRCEKSRLLTNSSCHHASLSQWINSSWNHEPNIHVLQIYITLPLLGPVPWQ